MKKVLTIAGSDSSGGAGIQADLKTFCANGVYGMSVITAITAQNTTGVFGVEDISVKMVEGQLDAVFEDIFPDAVKIGMVSSPQIIEAIAKKLEKYKPENIVLDPVMVSTSGASLIADEAYAMLTERLIPLADIITPNIPEAQRLSGIEIKGVDDIRNAAKIMGEMFGVPVLLKGGHGTNDSNDLLYKNGEYVEFKGERINNPNTHGTGCTLSSAIAANLAKGLDMENAISAAKEYIAAAIAAQLDLGKGSGPLMHNFMIRS